MSDRSASTSIVSRPHRAFTCVTACIFAESPSDPFHRRLRRIRCLLRRFDCYWASDPSQAGLSPARIHTHSRRTDASNTGSHRAIGKIPKDIIICDWHYRPRDDYPSVRFFQQQGFRVLPSTWKNPDAAVALVHCARKDASERMLGILFTGWSAGGNGEHLMAALKGQEINAREKDTAKQIAATIRAGLNELAAAANRPAKGK